MADASFYSERVGGPSERVHPVLPPETQRGLLTLIGTKFDANWFARAYPVLCQEGNGVVGTNRAAFLEHLVAVVPDAPVPFWDGSKSATDETVFDVVEFAARHAEKPRNGREHPYYRHHELEFDRKQGLREFCAEMNTILRRGRVMFELAPSGKVRRLGTREVERVVDSLKPDTADLTLDQLIEDAVERYVSYHDTERAAGLQQLWGAFERLKTLDLPGKRNKSKSAEVLLQQVQDEAWREVLRNDMVELARIGNAFHIRHFETDRHALPSGGEDYLFGRLGGLLIELLRASNRLGRSGETPGW